MIYIKSNIMTDFLSFTILMQVNDFGVDSIIVADLREMCASIALLNFISQSGCRVLVVNDRVENFFYQITQTISAIIL